MGNLVNVLAYLVDNTTDIRHLVTDAGLPPATIDFQGASATVWSNVISVANKQKMLDPLLARAIELYPAYGKDLADARELDCARSKRSGLTSPLDADWRGLRHSTDGIEKLMGKQPTFLPISFLEVGLECSRPVARIDMGENGSGSGFLIDGNLLLTNHHVIPSATAALAALVQFNFQVNGRGLSAEVDEFRLDPASGFATSPLDGGDDWTAVRIKGDAVSKWGSIRLTEARVGVDGFVNIIQHPQGQPKQIALYHNVVTFADEKRVQYLTDTLPGSSGSPVFDSQWRLVAIHHSGGWITEPGTKRSLFRNEGIAVGALLRGLRFHGLYQ